MANNCHRTCSRTSRDENIFKEAVDANFDQLLMVARNDESHLYLLSNGRVKKGITFEKDITGAFVEFFSEKGLPDPQVECELNVTAAIGHLDERQPSAGINDRRPLAGNDRS